MVRMGLRVRVFRLANSRMRREVTLLRQVVGQDHRLVLEHRERESELAREKNELLKSKVVLGEKLFDQCQRAAVKAQELEGLLNRVPRWVRWLFKAT